MSPLFCSSFYRLSILSLFFIATSSLQAKTFSVNGKGQADIVAGDIQLAQKMAERNAKRNGLEAAAIKLLPTDSQQQSFHNRKMLLWKEMEKTISKTTLLDRYKVGNGAKVEVQLVLQINKNSLLSVLKEKELRSPENDPLPRRKVLIIVAEEIQGVYGQLSLTEDMQEASTTLTKLLTDKGFIVLDNQQLQRRIRHDKSIQQLVGNAATAAALGLKHNADLILTGKAMAKQSTVSLGDLKTNVANVSFKLLETDTARIIATASGTKTKPHIDEVSGGRIAIGLATEEAVASILKQASKHEYQHLTKTLDLSVSGISHFQLAILKKIFKKEFQQINEIHQRSYVNQLASLELSSQEKAEDLADEITLKDFGAFRLRVDSVSANQITAHLIMKQ